MTVMLSLLFFAGVVSAKPDWVGNVIGSSVPSSFDKYWDQITPENAGKWGSVETTQGDYKWSNLDLIYDHAKKHHYQVKYHNLVWGNQYPDWLSKLSTSSQTDAIHNWIKQVGLRYANRTNFIDVVNEPLHTNYPFKDALGGAGSTGWDWVINSFKLAREHFPTTKLLINEYGIVNDENSRKKYLSLVNLLKTHGGLIDGIGVQSHCFNVDHMSGSQMKSALDDLKSAGLPLYISELDITGGGSSEANQLKEYQDIFPVMYNHPSVKGITLWGYISGETWKANTGIVNSNGSERQAMKWLVKEGYVGGGPTPPTPAPPPTPTPPPTPGHQYQQQTTTCKNAVAISSELKVSSVKGCEDFCDADQNCVGVDTDGNNCYTKSRCDGEAGSCEGWCSYKKISS